MRLYLIRHAEPDYPNKTITAAGHLEAEALGERLAADGITRIFSSPLGRAIHTMEYTARRLNLEPTLAPWTAELATCDTDVPPWGRMIVWDIPGEVLRVALCGKTIRLTTSRRWTYPTSARSSPVLNATRTLF